MSIHETARVHASVVLEGDVEIGPGAVVDPYCVIRGPVVIGPETHIYPSCVIGTEAEHRTKPSVGTIRIGSQTIIRELAVVHRGIGDAETSIGNRCFVMAHAHICHDVVIGDDVTISLCAALAGHTHVHHGANIGASAVLHQFSTVGAYAMVGMGAVVTRDVWPLSLVAGNPARFKRFNTHVFGKLGISAADLPIANGEITTTHASVKPLFDAFVHDARRKKMSVSG